MRARGYDLSFGAPVKVLHRGERVSSGTHFLGAAIGHRARVGAEVILGYGAEVPNLHTMCCVLGGAALGPIG